MDSSHSVTQFISDLKAGHEASRAQQFLFNRYFLRLESIARKKLGNLRAPAGADDVVSEALCAFFDGVQREHFPQLDDRHDLWAILTTITARRAINHFQREIAEKRGGGNVRGESVFEQLGDSKALDRLIGEEMSPDFADSVFDDGNELLQSLPDDNLRQIAILRLQGYTPAEIGIQLHCSARTIQRRIGKIRQLWHSHFSVERFDASNEPDIVHELCEQYAAGRFEWGIEPLAHFIQSCEFPVGKSDHLLKALLIVDLQERIATAEYAPQPLWFFEYQAAFPALFEDKEYSSQFGLVEFRCRLDTEWEIAPFEFLQHFDNPRELSRKIDERLGRDQPFVVRVYVLDDSRFQSYVNEHPLVIGRQRSKDPNHYAIVHEPKGRRLVVASRTNKRISRNHIELLAQGDRIRLRNISERSQVLLESGQKIHPGESISIQANSSFRIGEMSVQIAESIR